MESWFDEALELPYAEVLTRWGFPAVHTEANFKKPSRNGEVLTFQVKLGRIGRSSIKLEYLVWGPDGVLRATGATTCATVGLDPNLPDHLKAVGIPAKLRTAMEDFNSR